MHQPQSQNNIANYAVDLKRMSGQQDQHPCPPINHNFTRLKLNEWRAVAAENMLVTF